MDTRAVSIGLILAGAALDGSAVTLGSPQGAAWIGRPLELTFPIALDPDAEPGPLCPMADVFYADTPLEPGRIQIQSEPGTAPDTLRVRLSSTALVDEPVVRVVLRVGCQHKVSRSYVMLADLPAATPAFAREALPAPLVVPLVTSPLAEAATSPPATPRARAPAPNRHAGERVRPPVRATTKTKPPNSASEPQTASTASGSRLKLDPLEILVERVKTLESTTAAVPLEDLVKDSNRVQQLQNDVQALLKQAEKNEAALQAMRERLEKAESDRLSTLLSFGLAALALLCAVVIAVVWSRRRDPAWRQDSTLQRPPTSATDSSTGDTTLPAQELQLVKTAAVPATTAAPVQPPLDVDLVEMDEWDWPKTGRQTLPRR